MLKAMKKVLVGALAASIMMTSVAFAADSPTSAPQPTKQESVVTDAGTVTTAEDGSATINAIKSSKKSVKVASTITVNGVEYTVTTIGASAFKNCKKATKVTLPSTITTISKNAFKGCKKLKTVTLTGSKPITVKKGAFKGLDTKKMTIKVSKKMSKKDFKAFKKALKKAGFKGTVKK